MDLLQDLSFSLSRPGPEQVNGTGNYCLQVLSTQLPVLDLYFFDSHEQIPSDVRNPDYAPIKQSQIDWFKSTSQQLRSERASNTDGFHVSLAFLHIPLPEFGSDELLIMTGNRREPTEGPSENTHLYDALAVEGVAAIGCGHDHVNNFSAVLPRIGRHPWNDQESKTQYGPWLCYGGGSGFGGYCSYGKERFHRRTRVWELDVKKKTLKTWARVEYATDRIDELVLVNERDN
jgi:3',5'-cyclic AMP phosphodiesterase CpdA